MEAQTELIVLRIHDQEFRLRAAPEEREEMERVAAQIERQIDEHRRNGTVSDARAAIMVAYELLYEREDWRRHQEAEKQAELALQRVSVGLDRLTARLTRELLSMSMGSNAPAAKPEPAAQEVPEDSTELPTEAEIPPEEDSPEESCGENVEESGEDSDEKSYPAQALPGATPDFFEIT